MIMYYDFDTYLDLSSGKKTLNFNIIALFSVCNYEIWSGFIKLPVKYPQLPDYLIGVNWFHHYGVYQA